MSAPPRDIPALTSLRALAALFVFVFHIGRWDVWVLPGAGVGRTGVGFFFVLSGFLLTWGYWDRLDPRSFFVRRAARIYPAHLAMLLVAALVPVVAVGRAIWTLPLNALLLQGWIPLQDSVFSFNGVSWSLGCEIAFYAGFPFVLGFLRNRQRWLVMIVCGSLLLAELVVDVLVLRAGSAAWQPLAAYAMPMLRAPEFVLGVGAAILVRRQLLRIRAAGVVGLLGIALFGSLFRSPEQNVPAALAYVAVIVIAVRVRASALSRVLSAPVAVYAGKVSFAFYLVHELVILNLRPVLGAGVGAAALMLAASAIMAIMLHELLEVPAQRWLVRRFDSSRRVARSDPVAS